MKRLFFLVITISTFYVSAVGQSLITKSDSISISQDSLIKLVVPEYRGLIQWQKSIDGANWMELEGENTETLVIEPKEESMYRAKIVDGACLPVYSDSAMVILSKDSISSYLVAPADSGLVLISDSSDISNGIYNYFIDTSSFSGIDVGSIIFDEGSGGNIRKATEVIYNNDTITVETEQATLEDLFIDTDFKLSTELISASQSLKSASFKEISKALTDDDGFIHPYEVKLISDKGVELKSAFNIIDEGDTTLRGGVLYKKWDFSGRDLLYMSGEENLATKMYAPDGSLNSYEYEKEYDLRFYIDEGYFEIDPVFKFEFDFDRPNVDWKKFKVNTGELKYFAFYSDESKVDFKTILAMDAHYQYKDEMQQTLIKDFFKAQFSFAVPPGIPVIIEVSSDLIGKLYNEISAEAHASTGLQSTHYVTFGAQYIQDEGWSTIKGYENENTYFPISVDGGARWNQRLEIFPQVDFLLYTVFGPSVSLVPYVNSNVGASLAGNYDAKIDAGFDANAGVKVEVLGKTIKEYKTGNKNLLNWTLLQIPYQMEILKGNNQSATVNTYLPEQIEVKVYDKSGKIEGEGVKVYFNPLQGTVDSEVEKTNSNGIATCKWQMSSQPVEHQMEVYFKNGDDEIAEDGKIVITAHAENANTIPSVSTNSPTNITETTATLNGNVTSDGGASITQRGFYWSSTDQTPDSNDNPTTASGTTGSFSKNLTNLIPNTTYYYAAYAKNSEGTKVGGVQSFKTSQESTGESGTFTDSRDGNSYKWVKIGEQVWMAENLAYLPSVNLLVSESDIEPLYYVYNYSGTGLDTAKDNSNYSVYGVLYNFPAAQDACPTGWHLPSKDEWKQLFQYVDEQKGPYEKDELNDWPGIGKHLKSKNGWIYNGNGTDDFGFNGLPGGMSWKNEFSDSEKRGYWWGATTNLPYYDNYVVSVQLDFSHDNFNIFWDTKVPSKSVRCIKD